MKSLEQIRQFLEQSANLTPLGLLNAIEDNGLFEDLLYIHLHPEDSGLNSFEVTKARIRLSMYYGEIRKFNESHAVISEVLKVEDISVIEPLATAYVSLIVGKYLSKSAVNLQEGEKKLINAVMLFSKASEPAWELNALINLAGAYVYQGKFFEVFGLRERVDDLLVYYDEESIHRTIFYVNLAKSYYGVGEVQLALDYLNLADENKSPYFEKVGLKDYIQGLRTEYQAPSENKEESVNRPSIRTAMPVLHMRYQAAKAIRENNRDPLYDSELVGEALLPDSSPAMQDQHSIKSVGSRVRHFREKTLSFLSQGYIESDASGTDSEVESDIASSNRRKTQSGKFRKIQGYSQDESSRPFRQILLLGSGFDMLAGELYKAGHDVKIVEVELNEQAIDLKKQIYKKHELAPDVTYHIGSYLDNDLWAEAISTLDRSSPVLILLEGNIYYLTASQINDLFERINHSFSLPVVCCDYITTELYHALCYNDFSRIRHPEHIPDIRIAGERFRKHAASMGVSWKGHIDGVDNLAKKHDLEVIHNKSFIKLLRESGYKDNSGIGRYNRFTIFSRAGVSQSDEFLVRKALRRDLEGIADVHLRSFVFKNQSRLPEKFLNKLDNEYFCQKWGNILKNENMLTLIVERQRKILGFAKVNLRPLQESSELEYFYVHPNHWRKGIGALLGLELGKCLVDCGVESVHGFAVKDDEQSYGFYESMGAIGGDTRELILRPDDSDPVTVEVVEFSVKDIKKTLHDRISLSEKKSLTA